MNMNVNSINESLPQEATFKLGEGLYWKKKMWALFSPL